MSRPKGSVTGIYINGGKNIDMRGNTFVGMDTAIHVQDGENITASENRVISREVQEAALIQDPHVIRELLGIPPRVPASAIADALQLIGENIARGRSAEVGLRDSELAERVGVAANLTQLISVASQFANSGVLGQIISIFR